MTETATSLDRLHDVVLPQAVPWWPLPVGWQLVVTALFLVAVAILFQKFFQWQANRYRREALKLLGNPHTRPAEWSSLLKRTALAVWPRQEVAHLTGESWLAFLDRTGNMTGFCSGAGQDLELLTFSEIIDPDAEPLKSLVHDWIVRHRKEAVS